MHICIRIELMISLHMHVNGASCHIIHCTILSHIVGKKWDTGILDPGPFSGQIRKVEARLGKGRKIGKLH